MTRSMRALAAALLGLLVAAAAMPAGAAWPERPVKLVVAFPAGGGTDVVARLLAQRLTGTLGRQVVVENRPGAGATLGADHVAKSTDGHTLLVGTSAELTISPGFFPIAYDPVADFEPLALLGVSPVLLLANPTFPAGTLTELVARARQAPGTIAIASGGQGAAPHLAAELLRVLTGIDVIIVPYKGAGPALADLVSGQVPLSFSTIASALPQLQARSVKALGTITATRSPLLPDVAAAGEQGIADYEVVTWFGLFAPARVPAEVAALLRRELDAALRDPEIVARLAQLGTEVGAVDPDGQMLRGRIGRELARWRQVIQAANVKPE